MNKDPFPRARLLIVIIALAAAAVIVIVNPQQPKHLPEAAGNATIEQPKPDGEHTPICGYVLDPDGVQRWTCNPVDPRKSLFEVKEE